MIACAFDHGSGCPTIPAAAPEEVVHELRGFTDSLAAKDSPQLADYFTPFVLVRRPQRVQIPAHTEKQ